MIIKGKSSDWEIVIGLEIHAQVISNSKLFSSSSAKFGAEQNVQVSFVDAGMPGMLPILNQQCVDQAIRTGLGLNAKINLISVFDRKNYFYPDLPQGYQISQFTHPIVGNGSMVVDMPSGISKEVRITRIHLEQDAGKNIHDQSPNETFVDLNRAGVALMEIVTEPDMRDPEEAVEFMRQLRVILRYLGTCDGNMEQGSLRCDANVSVRPVGSMQFGTRVEIKNLNSMRYIHKAICYESERQVEVIENGGSVYQETRLFDVAMGVTRAMRDKETSTDYRYFPDPDLLPLIITEQHVENLRRLLPELPEVKKRRYMQDMGLQQYEASVITADKDVADYFEQVAKNVEPKLAAHWIIGELFRCLNDASITISQSPVTATHLSSLLRMLSSGEVSGKIAKDVFNIMFKTSETPENIVQQKGLKQISDVSQIEEILDEVIASNMANIEKYKSGEGRVLGFLIGQAMKKTKNMANPQIVNEVLLKKLRNM